jgi:hypothetical protein
MSTRINPSAASLFVGASLVATVLAAAACGGSDEQPDRGTAGFGGGSGCTINEWSITGSFEGEALDAKAIGHGAAYLYGWTQTVYLEGGLVRTWGEETFEEGDAVTTEGVFLAPPGSIAAGKVLFSKSARVTFLEPLDPVHLEQLNSVGTCPGSPVAGSLSICFANGIQGECPDSATGSLDGRDVSYAVKGKSSGSSSTPEFQQSAQAGLETDGFVVVQGGESMSGLLVLPSTDDDPLSAYCVGSTESSTQEDATTVTLTGLSRAGALPGTPIEGSLDFEFCMYP